VASEDERGLPWCSGRASHCALQWQALRVIAGSCDGDEIRREVRVAWLVAAPASHGVQHLSAAHQRILRLERIGEPVELLEPGSASCSLCSA
jgi:hypothetical protein